jgi:hypothetical protein
MGREHQSNCCKFINFNLSLLIFSLLGSSKLLNAKLLLIIISLEESFLIGICALYLNYPFVPFLFAGWMSKLLYKEKCRNTNEPSTV